MKDYLLNILLFILALILEIPLRLIGFMWAMIRSKDRIDYIKECTNSIDQTINAFGREMFNDLFITKDGYKFGVGDETISSALGKNKRSNTLSRTGLWLDKLLFKIDNNHTIKSIEENP